MAATSRVQSLMSTALVTVRDTDSIAAADTAMKLGSVRHVPVLDAKQNLVGILSLRDVLEALARGKKQVRVGEYMTRNVVTVTMPTRCPSAPTTGSEPNSCSRSRSIAA